MALCQSEFMGWILNMAIYFLPLNVYTAMILLNPAIVSLSQNVTINNIPTLGCD